ncbi:hypothetical protein [Flavobacterium sp.]|uniref:hypothetical protein n=1 Tax=Flavobacterium sp. TaxID=239 RepID=UPI00261EE832|nr:hypothetical protein [Flavobacterium sp.]
MLTNPSTTTLSLRNAVPDYEFEFQLPLNMTNVAAPIQLPAKTIEGEEYFTEVKTPLFSKKLLSRTILGIGIVAAVACIASASILAFNAFQSRTPNVQATISHPIRTIPEAKVVHQVEAINPAPTQAAQSTSQYDVNDVRALEGKNPIIEPSRLQPPPIPKKVEPVQAYSQQAIPVTKQAVTAQPNEPVQVRREIPKLETAPQPKEAIVSKDSPSQVEVKEKPKTIFKKQDSIKTPVTETTQKLF